MEADSNPASGGLSAVDEGQNTDNFQKVKSKKTEKRKRDQGEGEMEFEGAVSPKRPQFPPISGDRLKVTSCCSVMSCVQINSCLILLGKR